MMPAMPMHQPASDKLPSPYPWFGGKSRIAPAVWAKLGQVDNLIIPFFGSGAELLACPADVFERLKLIVVNDKDCHVANFWRSVREAPDEVARLCDEPTNEAEIEARHRWLLDARRAPRFAEQVRDDPEFFDPRAAAYWCYGLCSWIGGGWCGGEWHGRGDARNRGTGLVRDGGKVPGITSNGIKRVEYQREPGSLSVYMRHLAGRLRRVHVHCGDWSRPCRLVPRPRGLTGVILDPPYSREAGRAVVYRCDDLSVAHQVRSWAIKATGSTVRVALCGYDGEHRMPASWSCLAWTAQGGLATAFKSKRRADSDAPGLANRHRERVWFSPSCLPFARESIPGFARVVAHGAHTGDRASRGHQ